MQGESALCINLMASRVSKVFSLSIGKGMSSLLTIVVAICMARLLPKDEVGVYRQALLCYWIVAPLLEMGVRQALYYFVPPDITHASKWFKRAIIILLTNAVIFALGIAIFGKSIAALMGGGELMESMLWWLIPYALFHLPSMVQESLLVSLDKTALSAKVSVSRQVMISVGTLLPMLLWKDIYIQFVSHVIITAITGIAALGIVHWETQKRRGGVQSEVVQEGSILNLYKVALPLGISTILSVIAVSMDKFIVSIFYDAQTFAEYTYGAFEVPFISIITGSMMAIYLTEMRLKISSGQPKEAVKLFAQCANVNAAFLFPIFAFLLLIASDFIILLYGDDYSKSIPIFQIYLLLIPIRIVFFGPMMMALGESRKILKSSFLALLINFALTLIGVRFFGVEGAAVATIVTAYLFTVPYSCIVILRSTDTAFDELICIKDMMPVIHQLIIPILLCLGVQFVLQDGVNGVTRISINGFIFMSYYGAIYKRYVFSMYRKMFKGSA